MILEISQGGTYRHRVRINKHSYILKISFNLSILNLLDNRIIIVINIIKLPKNLIYLSLPLINLTYLLFHLLNLLNSINLLFKFPRRYLDIIDPTDHLHLPQTQFLLNLTTIPIPTNNPYRIFGMLNDFILSTLACTLPRQ